MTLQKTTSQWQVNGLVMTHWQINDMGLELWQWLWATGMELRENLWFQAHVSKVQILYPHIFYYHLDTSLAINKCKVKKCQIIWHKIGLLHFVNLWFNNKIQWNKWNQSKVNKNNNLNMHIVKHKYCDIESICIHTHKYWA